MSDGELARLEVLRDLDQRRLTTEVAAQLLGLERRQVFRLLKAQRTEGSDWFDFQSAAVASAIVLDQQNAGVEQVPLLAHRAFERRVFEAHPRLDAARLSNGAHLPAPGSHAYSVGIIRSVRNKASGRLRRAR
jgi:Homeodomain-like domain-containing protein